MRAKPFIFFLRRGLRGLARRMLKLCPPRPMPSPDPDARHIVVLFAGTYGDFVQLLPMLAQIAALWPKAALRVYAPSRLLRDFAFALPPRLAAAGFWTLARFLIRPADILLTGAVGVYRVRYDLLAWRLARVTAGFRYAHEASRTGFGLTLPLTPDEVNFGESNQKLVAALAARNQPSYPNLPLRLRVAPSQDFPFGGPVLFSVGSAGFKQAMGLAAYLGLIDALVALMGGLRIVFVAGPQDGDVAAHLARCHASRECWRLRPEDLADRLRAWPGGILGFDSFFAHFALYLGRRMVVLHYGRVPHGYDCAPFHLQIVLNEVSRLGGGNDEGEHAGGQHAGQGPGLDLEGLRAFLAEASGRQVLPLGNGPGQNLP